MILVPKVLLVAVVACAAVILSPTVRAQTEGEAADADGVQVVRRIEGAFDIAVAVQPSQPLVGPVHFVVTVLEAGTASPVDRATIKITVTSPGGDALEVRAVGTPQSLGEYRANLTLGSSGEWTLTVELEREGMGSATIEVPLVIGEWPLPAGNAGTLVWFFILVVLAGGALYVWRRSRSLTARG